MGTDPAPPPNAVAPGALRWSAALPGQPGAVAGDAAGNVYVAMSVFPQNGGAPVAQIWKFDASGRKQWSTQIGPSWWEARARMAITGSGDVVMGVCSAPFCYSAEPSAVHTAVMRITSAGKVAWTTALPGPLGTLDADARGRTLVTVSSGDLVTGLGYRLILLGDRGEIALDQQTDLAFAQASLGSAEGDLVVAGKDSTGKLAFERRRSDGSLVFRNVLDAPGGWIDRLDLAANGSIAIGGWFEDRFTWGTTTYDVAFNSGFIAVARADGTPDWSREDFDLAGGGGVPPYLSFGLGDAVVAYTMTYGKGIANLRSYASDGGALWRRDFRGVYGTSVNPVAVAATGDIVVAALRTGDAPFTDLTYDGNTWYVAVLSP